MGDRDQSLAFSSNACGAWSLPITSQHGFVVGYPVTQCDNAAGEAGQVSALRAIQGEHRAAA